MMLHGRAMRRRALAGVLVALAALAGLCVTAVAGVAAGSGAARASTACRHAKGPFSVKGTEVVDGSGNPFIPYGITVPGLANWSLPSKVKPPPWSNYKTLDGPKIMATAADWCANTVRLQVSQDNLVGITGNSPPNPQYMAAIEWEVSLAERLGLVVVINDQTETATDKGISYQLAPTQGTVTFWKDIAHVYGGDPQVIFDLFNEPRIPTKGMSQQREWQLWFAGGKFKGVKYVGMDPLADDVRADGGLNLLWVEGPDYAKSLAGMVRNFAVLADREVVYVVHHPVGPQTTSSWYKSFGYLIRTHVAPVVDGEWTNYIPFKGSSTACWPDAPKTIPLFLRYLAKLKIGMTAYQLQKGLLISGTSPFSSPTTINAQKWHKLSCFGSKRPPSNQGAGALIMNWYRQHNS